MLKNLYLSVFLIGLMPLASFTQSIDRMAHINTVLEHIAYAKKDIMLEMQSAVIIGKRAASHFYERLQEQYEPTRQHCMNVLKTILISPEFSTTIEQVTDKQLMLITQEMVNYNDIIIDPAAYSLEEKVHVELTAAAFDAQAAELFNVVYVVTVIIHGTKILIAKLQAYEQELLIERKAITASSQHNNA